MVSLFGFGSSSASSEASSSSAVASRSASPDSAVAHAAPAAVNPLNPKGIKPCCACPETKAVRDNCFLKNSPEEADGKCREAVEAHKACMRSYGFKV